MSIYSDERLLILIDGSNLYSTTKHLDFDIDYKKLLDFFGNKGRLIRANYYTALLEHDDFSAIRPLMDWLDYNGYHVITKRAREYTDRDGRRRVKGNMDTEIVVDMLEMAPHFDHIILISGDSDFRAAVRAVQQKGVRVSVLSSLKSSPPMLADELRRQADHIYEIIDLEREIGRESN